MNENRPPCPPRHRTVYRRPAAPAWRIQNRLPRTRGAAARCDKGFVFDAGERFSQAVIRPPRAGRATTLSCLPAQGVRTVLEIVTDIGTDTHIGELDALRYVIAVFAAGIGGDIRILDAVSDAM